jgi:hypothetical protein
MYLVNLIKDFDVEEAVFFELVVFIKPFAFDQFAVSPNQFVVGKLGKVTKM